MTPAQRTTVSFLDLALIMTGVMALIASVGDRHPAVAEALTESFGTQPTASVERIALPLATLFEPHEARLTRDGAAKIAALGGRAGSSEIGIAVPVATETGTSRFNRWELAAARTAAIMRVLADQGIADSNMVPDLARPAAGERERERAREVMLTVRSKPTGV